jgi:hypothetical protein
MITEQQSREAFEKHFRISKEARQNETYGGDFTHCRWDGWQAALKFAEEQQNKLCAHGTTECDLCPNDPPSPQPPAGYHLATDEERKCLPEGSKFWDSRPKEWRKTGLVKVKALETLFYACPDAPTLVTFTDGKLNPPPFGQWHKPSHDNYEERDFPSGYRPLLEGEEIQEGDEFKLHPGDYRAHTPKNSLNIGKKLNSGEGWSPHRTRRPLPAPPAEEWVPLTAEDISPGSALRTEGNPTWGLILGTGSHVITSSWGNTIRYSDLVDNFEILHPGQTEWQPCKKLKTT